MVYKKYIPFLVRLEEPWFCFTIREVLNLSQLDLALGFGSTTAYVGVYYYFNFNFLFFLFFFVINMFRILGLITYLDEIQIIQVKPT
jgi:hypothetical protein